MLTVLVTGATNGIGLETARVLTGMGHTVLLHGRNPRKGQAALALLRARGATNIRFLQADFASLADVRRLATEVAEAVPRLDVLINNAGGANFTRRTTLDGHEMTFAVNHLAPFLLTNLLLPKLRQSSPARIVTVASRAHRNQRIDFADLMSARRYQVMRAYGRSKLANILFTRALAKRLVGTGIIANSLHPGLVATGIGQTTRSGRLVWRIIVTLRGGISLQEGARTSVYLATSPEVAGTTGEYFSACRPAPLLTAPEAVDEAVSEQLWRASAELVGLPGTTP